MHRWYELDEQRNPVPVDVVGGARALGKDRKVGRDERVIDGQTVKVSTVFLALNHAHEDGPPVLYETLVFGGEMDGECVRYHTWAEAEAGHRAMVERVFGKA